MYADIVFILLVPDNVLEAAHIDGDVTSSPLNPGAE